MTSTLSREQLRRAAASSLTALLESHSQFSFIRLGDGEVKWLREVQAGENASGYHYEIELPSCEVVRSVYGMEARHYPRFLAALTHATYLDRCDSIPRVRHYLQELNVSRASGLFGNASPETSNIIFEWVWHELRSYLGNHRCLFAAAEAALLRELSADLAYQAIARELLLFPCDHRFHQIEKMDGATRRTSI